MCLRIGPYDFKKKYCTRCGSHRVHRHGKSANSKPRFRCLVCKKTFIWKQTFTQKYNERHWFKLWVLEGYSIRQLVALSGHSRAKILRIKDHWLPKVPPAVDQLHAFKYLVLDGTYFHKDGCLVSLMSAEQSLIVSNLYVPKEGFKTVCPWLMELKRQGLRPTAVTTDGEISVLRALRLIWPHAIFQRCLYHIQHEGCRWLRSYPSTEAGRELRRLLLTLSSVKSVKERDAFIQRFRFWKNRHQHFVIGLPHHIKANIDLLRTVRLIDNALPNMFHYLMNPSIHSTTNALEGWHSILKRSYRQHAGLTQAHKIQFLRWFSHFKNQQKSHNF